MADETPEFDMNAAVDSIGSDLGFGEEETAIAEKDDAIAETAAPDVVETPAEEAAPAVREPPKSWAKEKHEIWSKLPPEAQEQIELREKQILDGLDQYKGDAGFGKQIKDAIAPFQQMLDTHKVDAPKAVAYLLSAHQRLSYGSQESRLAAYQELGRNLGLTTDQNAPPIDPNVKALQEEVERLKSGMTAREQAELNEVRVRTEKTVAAFAEEKDDKGNPLHPYFDEVADDIIPFLNAGAELKDAYDKAVWANPVTRAKETARLQQASEKKLRENARLDALKAKTATSTNVRSRETTRAPTEPLGTMDETMKETFREIQSRTH